MSLENITSLTQNFFEKLGVNFSQLQVQNEAENIYRVSLKSEDSHILIGPHGKNLESITHIIKILFQKNHTDYVNVHVEINDYLEKKDEKLIQFIDSKIALVQESGKDVVLPFFSAYERKKVHSHISEKGENTYTQSVGEGKDRRIHICKKDEKMSIDIDGDDI